MNLEKIETKIEIPKTNSKLKKIILAWIGSFICVSAIVLVSEHFEISLMLGSFGASCFLLFSEPHGEFSKPKNIIFAHFFASLIGLSFMSVLGYHWWSVALAVGSAIAFMMATDIIHPPAGSNPFIIFLTKPAWSFLLFPTLVGAILIVIIGVIYNNFVYEKVLES